MHEDQVLVARIRRGDLQAFETLYHKYRLTLYRAALAITGNHADAEEILQDAFVRAYAALDRVDATISLSPWLHRIVVNLSYNWLRREKQWLQALGDLLESLAAGPANSPQRAAEEGELSHIVHEALDSLAAKHRLVIILFHLQGFRLHEIAYILEIPEGTVKSRLHYATRALRARLGKDGRLAELLVQSAA
jgi:RNA polymerase sigma-70 factor (ECF subfamily)